MGWSENRHCGNEGVTRGVAVSILQKSGRVIILWVEVDILTVDMLQKEQIITCHARAPLPACACKPNEPRSCGRREDGGRIRELEGGVYCVGDRWVSGSVKLILQNVESSICR